MTGMELLIHWSDHCTAEERRLATLRHFGLLLVEVMSFLPWLIVVCTGWRLWSVWDHWQALFPRYSPVASWRRLCGGVVEERVKCNMSDLALLCSVWGEFGAWLLDLPFAILFFAVLPIVWRSPGMIRALREGDVGDWDRRKLILQNAYLIVLDVPCTLLLFVHGVCLWRLPMLWQELAPLFHELSGNDASERNRPASNASAPVESASILYHKPGELDRDEQLSLDSSMSLQSDSTHSVGSPPTHADFVVPQNIVDGQEIGMNVPRCCSRVLFFLGFFFLDDC
jgi:hypothetical protein